MTMDNIILFVACNFSSISIDKSEKSCSCTYCCTYILLVLLKQPLIYPVLKTSFLHRGLQTSKAVTRQLEVDSRKMEDRLRELKLAMNREKEERES